MYDLSWDPQERSNLATVTPEIAKAMGDEVRDFVVARGLDRLRREPVDGTLAERAERAFQAARRDLLAEEHTETDAVWFTQLVLRQRDDPALRTWVEQQIPLHREALFYGIVRPDTPPAARLEGDPGRGIGRWVSYTLAAVAGPDQVALAHLQAYLDAPASGYLLTHQFAALEWAHRMQREFPDALFARREPLLARIAEEHARDVRFSDLYVERAAFLAAFSDVPDAALREWVEFILEHQAREGDWGDGSYGLHFDGETRTAQIKHEHTRGLAMIVLARFLASEESAGARNAQ